MSASRRFVPIALLIAVLVAGAAWFLYRGRAAAPPPVPARPIVAAIRAEPRSFNRFVAGDRSTSLISQLVHARLVQLNHRTQEIEPALATKWTLDPDGRTYTLTLRQGVVFSDGTPFTADDVVFTFAALYDPKAEGPLASSLRVNGQPLAVRKIDAHTVVLTMPSSYGPGLRLLSSLPILPAHKLRDALARGEFAKAWSTATPPAEIVGLGPFVIRSYTPGERVELARNQRHPRHHPSEPADESFPFCRHGSTLGRAGIDVVHSAVEPISTPGLTDSDPRRSYIRSVLARLNRWDVLVPAGVGSLLQAALSHYRSDDAAPGTVVVSVEPRSAACVLASVAAGHPVTVATGTTVMAGLNCGTVSSLAWPYISRGLDACVAVDDAEALDAARELAEHGVDAGPCGAATLAALHRIRADAARELTPESTVVLLVTEGSAANPAG